MTSIPGPIRALRFLLILNVLCLAVTCGIWWMTSLKADETAASHNKFLPLETQIRGLIESEREIEKLRDLARLQHINALGNMESLLHVSRKVPETLLPFAAMPLAGLLVAGAALRSARKPTAM